MKEATTSSELSTRSASGLLKLSEQQSGVAVIYSQLLPIEETTEIPDERNGMGAAFIPSERFLGADWPVKTQYYTATSIDGYLADEDNSLDWLFQFGEIEEIEGVDDEYSKFIDQIGALAMGSTTYEWIIEHENLLEHPEKWSYEAPTWVFSTRELPVVEGADIHFVQGDVASVHQDMIQAADGKNVWLVGGGDLVGQFHDQNLLDEIILSVAPVMLASGAPLLPRRITTPPLRLVSVEKQGDVFAVLTYEVQQSTEN